MFSLHHPILRCVIVAFTSAAFVLLFLVITFHSPGLRWLVALSEPFTHLGLLVFAVIGIVVYPSVSRTRKVQKLNGIETLFRNNLLLQSLLPAIAIILSTFPLFHSWVTCQPDGQITKYAALCGAIPWGDASRYYAGSQYLLNEGKLTEFNQRRPINACLFAVRLALAKNDFRIAMVLQALLLGLAFFLAARAVSADFGIGLGVTFFALLLAFGRLFVQTTLSESLGLTLSALAFAVLWGSIRERNEVYYFLGLLFLSFALNARAGAFFVLPCLVVWGSMFFRKAKKDILRVCLIASLVISIGFIHNGLLNAMYGDGPKIGHGNFSRTLYGLAVGGKGWKQLYEDFPTIEVNNAAELDSFAYKKALEKISDDPLNLLVGYGHYFIISLVNFNIELMNLFFSFSLPSMSSEFSFFATAIIAKAAALLLMFLLLFFGARRFFWQNRRDSRVHFIITGLFGILLSLPLIYVDAGQRVLSSVFPFIGVGMTFSIVFGYRLAVFQNVDSMEDQSLITPPLVIGLFLIMISSVGPMFFGTLMKTQPVEPIPCPGETQSFVARVGPGSPHLNIVSSLVESKSFVPGISTSNFRKELVLSRTEETEVLGKFDKPFTLLFTCDLQEDAAMRPRYLIGPPGMVGKSQGLVHFCIQPTSSRKLFKVTSYRPIHDG